MAYGLSWRANRIIDTNINANDCREYSQRAAIRVLVMREAHYCAVWDPGMDIETVLWLVPTVIEIDIYATPRAKPA